MTNPDDSVLKIRSKFAEFCESPEQYRKFIEVFNRSARAKDRLLHWQQKLWNSFAAKHEESNQLSFADLVSVFRICHVHFMPLVDRQVKIAWDMIDVVYSPEYENALMNHFPYACEFAVSSPALDGRTHVTTDHCEVCWREMKRFARTPS